MINDLTGTAQDGRTHQDPPVGSMRERPEPAFTSPWMTVREAQWVVDGRQQTWYYQDHPGCALVLPVTTDGMVVLVRTWRVAVRDWVWEAPAGRVDPGETVSEAARRELAEEVGGRAGDLVKLGVVFASAGSSNERVHLFVATGVDFGDASPDPSEVLEKHCLAPRAVLDMVRDGLVQDAATALAVLWADGLRLLSTGHGQPRSS